MEHSLFSEGNSYSANQEIPPVLLNPKAHYRVQKSLPPVPTLSQMNSAYIFSPQFP